MRTIDLPSRPLASSLASSRFSALSASIWERFFSNLFLFASLARSALPRGKRKLRAKPSFTVTTSPMWPSFSTRSSRMICMVPPSLFHDEGQEADVTRTLDRLRQLALLLAGNGRDARRNDFAALGDEALKQANVLVINAGRILAGEGAALAPTEKWACHVRKPPLSRDFVAFATRAAIPTLAPVSTITAVSAAEERRVGKGGGRTFRSWG